ncbi:MAG TPA: hypothetical protein VII93_00625 [Anaerolineales bacterium]
MDKVQDWIPVNGIVVKGHRVASRPSKDYPYSTIEKQKPYFKERDLDLEAYFTGTLNISITPLRFEMIKPEFTFLDVAWTDLHPPEHFSFSRCKIWFQGREYTGLVYYPHPETKIRHQQNPSVIEVMTEYIPGISYGDRVVLLLNTNEILIIK